MANKKIQIKDATGVDNLYPVTRTKYITEASGATLDKIINEFNVSAAFPTGGSNSGNTYSIATAIAKVPTEMRSKGMRVTFISNGSDTGLTSGTVYTYQYVGSSWTAANFQIDPNGLENSLNSSATDKPLAAAQGKVLADWTNEINVSKAYPTGGTNSGNTYSFNAAINKIPSAERIRGIKVAFISDGSDGYLTSGELYVFEFLGGTWDNVGWFKNLNISYPDENPLLERTSNIYDDRIAIYGGYIYTDGIFYENSVYKCSWFIPVEASTTYTANANMRFVCMYDKDYNVVGYVSSVTTNFTTTGTTAYVRVTYYVNSTGQTLTKGSTAITYIEPYIGEFDILNGVVTEGKIADKAVSIKKLGITTSKNLFNPADPDFTAGYYVNSNNGNLLSSSSYNASGYIPVEQGLDYYLSYKYLIAWYDSSKTFISGDSSLYNDGFVVTAPNNAKYLRCTISNGKLSSFLVSQSSSVVPYTPYKEFISSDYLPAPSDYIRSIDGNVINDGSIPSGKLGINSVGAENLSFLRKNLFNPNDTDIEDGKFLSDAQGRTADNANYFITGYIPFTQGMGKLIASVNGNSLATAGGLLCYYDKYKNCIGGVQEATVNGIATWSEGVAYVRFSLTPFNKGTAQVEVGQTITPYVEYGQYVVPSNIRSVDLAFVDSLLGEKGATNSEASLNDGESIELTDFPYYIKKHQGVSFEANITSFSSVYVGKGYQEYRGAWVEIDTTNAVLKFQRDDETTVTVETVAHGLTISTFIKVVTYSNEEGELYMVLQTLGGTFTHTYNLGFEANSQPFAKSVGSSLTNVKINAINADFRCPVWVFGDSYCGVAINRWPYYVKQWGFFNFMLDGLAGLGSPGAYNELERALKFGTPKYIIWLLGMNDSTLGIFTDNFDKVLRICQAKNIEMIASTIPTVPSRDKEAFSQYVRNSGVRYIDVYRAVGANSSGQWYAGYLSSDNIHPDVLGAQAIASQVLVDFPELMQYGKTT